jgi:hypothetical protein
MQDARKGSGSPLLGSVADESHHSVCADDEKGPVKRTL